MVTDSITVAQQVLRQKHPWKRFNELLPWNWKKAQAADTLAA